MMLPLLIYVPPRDSSAPDEEPQGKRWPEGFGFVCLWWIGMLLIIGCFGVGEYFLRKWTGH